jgi:hypothetical protein
LMFVAFLVPISSTFPYAFFAYASAIFSTAIVVFLAKAVALAWILWHIHIGVSKRGTRWFQPIIFSVVGVSVVGVSVVGARLIIFTAVAEIHAAVITLARILGVVAVGVSKSVARSFMYRFMIFTAVAEFLAATVTLARMMGYEVVREIKTGTSGVRTYAAMANLNGARTAAHTFSLPVVRIAFVALSTHTGRQCRQEYQVSHHIIFTEQYQHSLRFSPELCRNCSVLDLLEFISELSRMYIKAGC